MARKPQTRLRGVHALPRREVVQPETPTHTDAGFTTLLESTLQPILAVTY